MERSDLVILQAASRVLNEKRPDPACMKILREYAEANMPQDAELPPDELATVIALKLMKAEGASHA